MKPPKNAIIHLDNVPDPYANMSTSWRVAQSDQNAEVCASLKRTLLSLERFLEDPATSIKDRIAATLAMTKVADSISKQQEQARKIGPAEQKPQVKAPMPNRPPQQPIQMNNCQVVLESPPMEPKKVSA